MFRSAESLSLLITAVSAMMLAIAVVTADSTPASAPLPAIEVSETLSMDTISNPAAVLPSMPSETTGRVRVLSNSDARTPPRP